MEQFLQYSDQGLFLLRLVVGIIFLYHGLPKLKNAKQMAAAMGQPVAMVLILGLVEVLGALALILGPYRQIAALALGIVMIGSTGMKMGKWGVKFAEQSKTGWEFDLVLLTANIVIVTSNGGSIGI